MVQGQIYTKSADSDGHNLCGHRPIECLNDNGNQMLMEGVGTDYNYNVYTDCKLVKYVLRVA